MQKWGQLENWGKKPDRKTPGGYVENVLFVFKDCAKSYKTIVLHREAG